MNAHYFEFKELIVSESISLFFHGLDLVVGSFQRSGGDRIVEVGQDSIPLGHEGVSEPCEHWDAGGPCSCHPIKKEVFGFLLAGK